MTVIDANNPAELLNSFGVCSNHILCIASVPGASASDYYETVAKIECTNGISVSTDVGKSETEKVEDLEQANGDDKVENGEESKEKENGVGEVTNSPATGNKQSVRSQEEQEETSVVSENSICLVFKS